MNRHWDVAARALVGGLSLMVAASPAVAKAAKTATPPPEVAEEPYEEPPPMPVFSWGGAYAGLDAGYAFGRDHAALTAPVTTVRAVSPTQPVTPGLGTGGAATIVPVARPTAVTVQQTAARSLFADGVIGGGHVGYNVVTAVSLERPVGVFGVEADVDGASYGRRAGGVTAGPGYTAYAFDPAISDLHRDVGGSLRGRAGVGVKRVLLYGTGGLAVARFSSAIPGVADGRSDVTRVGYTVGGGLEYAVTNHVALRAEYRYDDYGRTADAGAAAIFPGAALIRRESFSRLQGGISYLFADPVVPARP